MKDFFGIKTKYQFEWNDLRCGGTIINVLLIMLFGLSISWFGLGIAIIGLIKDFTSDRHLNSILMHFSSVILNIYFLSLVYCG